MSYYATCIALIIIMLSFCIVKVRTVTLFGEVWGIGPATALKLYEKGYRTLDDLKNDGSLTNSQRLGLKYFDDIKKKIPRHEVKLVYTVYFYLKFWIVNISKDNFFCFFF